MRDEREAMVVRESRAVSAALSSKATNPKDGIGSRKWRKFESVPATVLWELGVAMMEGQLKYGRHNFRAAGVRASVYFEAALGHLTQWWEGEDTDPDTRLSHLVKAMASLAVLRDAMVQAEGGKAELFVDDRPPKTADLDGLRARLQGVVDAMVERHGDSPAEPVTEINKDEWSERNA